jgi:hypothetical protein
MENYNFMLHKLAGKGYSAEDALGDQIQQEAAVANREWAMGIREANMHERAIENAAALAIQYRFRLRRKGLLKYWMWELPSFLKTRDRLLREYEKVLGMKEGALAVQGNDGVYDDPEEWETCDDGNGNVYYFNVKTGVSSWEAPTFHPTIVRAGVQMAQGPGWNGAAAGTLMTAEEADHAGTVYENPEEWEQLVCGDGTTYYYNTRTAFSSWRRPNFRDADDYERITRVATESVDEAIERAENWDIRGEHPEWKVVIEKDFETRTWKRPYWYCASLEISSWEAPRFDAMGRLLGMKKKIGIEDTAAALQNDRSVPVVVRGTEGEQQLPLGWETCYDEEGNTYYYSEELGESRWEAPLMDEFPAVLQEDEEREEEEEEYATEVPSGGGSFELCYDEQGNQYLYDAETGESAWLESGYEFDAERQELKNTVTGEWKAIDVAVVS